MKSRRIFKIILITAVLVIVLSIPAFATAKTVQLKVKRMSEADPELVFNCLSRSSGEHPNNYYRQGQV